MTVRQQLPWSLAALFFLLAPVLASPVPLNPKTCTPSDGASPPEALPHHEGLRFPIPFDGPMDRVYWDIPLRLLPPSVTTLAIDLACEDPAAIRALTLHLQSGPEDWLVAQKSLENSDPHTLYFDRSDFSVQSGKPLWNSITHLRLSAWKAAARATTLTVRSIRPMTLSVGILRATPRTAPGETALAEASAQRAQRLFLKAGIPSALLSDGLDSLDLQPYRLLILPYNPALSSNDVSLLERYITRRNGRLAVFYNANERLATTLGFDVLPYVSQSENWSTVSFTPGAVPGLPASMPHFTRNLIPVRARSPSATTLGTWLTPDGIPDRTLPAAAVSPRGLWFSHLPPLASPSAVHWIISSLAASDSFDQPALDQYLADSSRRDTQAASMSSAFPSPPPPNEIRAVWTLPIPSRLRDETYRTLAQYGFNTLFEPLLTLADNPAEDRPLQARIARAMTQARTNGLSLHAWVVCWSLDGLPPELIATYRVQGRLMQDANGNSLNWLCPSHPTNRALLLTNLVDLARRDVDGIHLDYIRYPARTACFCPASRTAFERFHGHSVQNWPADVLPGGPLETQFDQFRRDDLSAFVADAAKIIRSIHPGIRFSAAVYPTPESAAENGQDWPRWLRDGSLDFVAPMLYTTDSSRFATWLDGAIAAAPSPAHILPGIGSGADESQLDALGAAEQITAARKRNSLGFTLFQLDSDLLNHLLPALFPQP